LNKQSNLSRLMEYAGNFRFFTYASWILSAVSALLALLPYWYLWKILKEVIDTMPNFGQAENLVHNGWMAVIFAISSALLYVASLMCSHIAAFRVASRMRIKLTHHIVKLPLALLEGFGSGKLRKIIDDSSSATENYLAHKLPDKANAIATPIGLLALLLIFDWRLGLLSLIPVVLAFTMMMTMTGESMKQRMGEYQNALEDMSNEAVEYVRGIPVVKTFGQTVFSFKKFKASIDNYKKWVISYTRELCMPMVVYTAAIHSVFAFLIGAAIFFTKKGISSEFILNFMFYVIVTPIISLTLTRIMYQSENVMIVEDALKRIDSVLLMNPLMKTDFPKYPNHYSVEIQNVSYSYDGEKNALDNISVTINEGEVVALVGPSGGGKTTLANLISRFFDPQKGKVLIGGVDIKDIPKAKLMNTVSFVFQNSRLLKTSILENVRMGKPDAGEEEIRQALKAAQCMDIIEKLPQGIHTVIGFQGTYLSGGEQQRIAIARAILKNTPILVLDEATAFADPDNEFKVQQALSALSKGKTVIMIAHRLSSIIHTHQIIVLEKGKVTERGSLRELMEGNGAFRRMWDSYQTSVQWKMEKEV